MKLPPANSTIRIFVDTVLFGISAACYATIPNPPFVFTFSFSMATISNSIVVLFWIDKQVSFYRVTKRRRVDYERFKRRVKTGQVKDFEGFAKWINRD